MAMQLRILKSTPRGLPSSLKKRIAIRQHCRISPARASVVD